MILDAFVYARLGDSGIVDFAMTVAPVADDIDDHVAAKLSTVVGGQLAYAHDGVRVFAVDVKDRNILALGDVRSEPRRLFLLWPGSKANQIVDDDVDCSANGVGLQICQIERLCPDALACEGSVAVHHNGHDFCRAAGAVPSLLGAHTSHGHGIDCFQ